VSSAVIGSWKIMAISPPRTLRSSSAGMATRSRPRHSTRPLTWPGSRIRRMMERNVTLLPEPDSPTRPTTSPGATSKSTSAAAIAWPRGVSKVVVRPRTISPLFSLAAPIIV
jgi:hypothetical protein